MITIDEINLGIAIKISKENCYHQTRESTAATHVHPITRPSPFGKDLR